MLGRILLLFSSMHVAYAILSKGEDKISALPDELVHILLLISTKDAVATMILSKRWHSIWTMKPKLYYYDDMTKVCVKGQKEKSTCQYINHSLQLHKAPILETLMIHLSVRIDVDANVGKWIEYAVDRKVRELGFKFTWSSAEPVRLSKSLYTCDTLVELYLLGKILVDVPSSACLPSLKIIKLFSVVYKDEDSLVNLLSNCPLLRSLDVRRYHLDNVRNFNIKVPSLECLLYVYWKIGVQNEGNGGSLVIDSPALKRFFYKDFSGDPFLLKKNPRLDKACINVFSDVDDKFMTSLSSLKYLELVLRIKTVACCSNIEFTQLKECRIAPLDELDWVELLMCFLHNSPNLEILSIDQTLIRLEDDFSLSWNQPISVPECLSTHLEIFELEGYRGRSGETETIRYIFDNSKCLRRAGISLESKCKLKHGEKMMREIESMPRISKSCELLFSTQLKYMDFKNIK